MSTPPLPQPERFESKRVTGYLTDQISVGKRGDAVALVLSGPEKSLSLIFETTTAGARQLAASILNAADELDEAREG